ncbi:hypothetical protein [Asticcacaulis sp. EMRT-3]|uniref:hypothetical protein n=1 Tax=Asticcacaulis sp. EMRT-3 TaxID=3040349 RepID=UPI0024AFECE4|nr:hypothetical protein [Asticcacaulis sp. EMRT-3]MDI7774228.1 hypothetical protein [Asticcacaulis sp. EMRT-3]
MPRFSRCSSLAILLCAAMIPATVLAGGYDQAYDHDGYSDNGYDRGYDHDGYSDQTSDHRDPPNAYERSHDDDAYAYAGDSQDDSGVPYAGRYLGYDYVSDEYYRWDGSPPQDHRDREQSGYRDGIVHTRPVSRARWYYDGYGCGCRSYGYGYGSYNRAYRRLDERQRDYTPTNSYSPRAYYHSRSISRSDFGRSRFDW